jgi:hypothetical protein
MCIKLCNDNDFGRDGFWCAGGVTMLGMQGLAEFRNEQKPTHSNKPVAKPPAQGEAANQPEQAEAVKGEPIPQSCSDLLVRRLVAEIGFALFALVGIVESVFRLALGLITLLPFAAISLCGIDCLRSGNGDGECWVYPILWIVEGATGIVDLPLRCLVAMVKNVTEKEFHFNELALCEVADVAKALGQN